MGLLASACFTIALHAARRIGGWWFAVVVAVGLVGTIRASDAATFVEVWNPWAGLAPFAALVMVCWLIALGNRGWLVLAIVLASFLVQAHLTYLPPSAVLLADRARGWMVARADREDDADLPEPAGRWRPIEWGIVAALVCWALCRSTSSYDHPREPDPGPRGSERGQRDLRAEHRRQRLVAGERPAPGLLPRRRDPGGRARQNRVDAGPAAWIGTVVLIGRWPPSAWLAWRRSSRARSRRAAIALGPVDRGVGRGHPPPARPPDRGAVLAAAGLYRRPRAAVGRARGLPLRPPSPLDHSASSAERPLRWPSRGWWPSGPSRCPDRPRAWMIDPARIAGEDLVAATSPGTASARRLRPVRDRDDACARLEPPPGTAGCPS